MKIFLSYASEDRDLADQVHLALAGAGHDVFFDLTSLPPAGDYHARIHQAVDMSDIFVFLISLHSIEKGSYCLTELMYSRTKWPHPKGNVLPVRIGQAPWEDIPGYLRAVTVLEPEGNVAAEVAYAVSMMPPEQVKTIEHTVPDEAAKVASQQTDKAVIEQEPKEVVAIPLERRTLAISIIHENGKPRSYTHVFDLGGHDLSFGQGFISMTSGDLHALIKNYSETQGARFAEQVREYLPSLKSQDKALVDDKAFKALLLKVAGEDPVMVRLQDEYIEKRWFGPARRECVNIGVRTELGFALVSDTFVQSGSRTYEKIKMATIKALDGTPSTGIDEKHWLRRFAEERVAHYAKQKWARMSRLRTATYIKLMEDDKWDLSAPLAVRQYLFVDP